MNVTMKQVEGGVCAAAGFSANGLNCGLNPDRNKNDLALIWSEKECTAAAVYTTNKVKGAPILVTKKHLAATGNKARAVIVNSKNANTCNADGEEKAQMMCDLAAAELGIKADEVMVSLDRSFRLNRSVIMCRSWHADFLHRIMEKQQMPS